MSDHETTPPCKIERVAWLVGGQSFWRCGRCGMQARATDKPECPQEREASSLIDEDEEHGRAMQEAYGDAG